MQCPVCKVDLLLSERQGIEIDYCPKCRGIWLDRGELDKIIQKSSDYDDNSMMKEVKNNNNYRDDDKHKSHGYNKYKRKSFLGDLFDF